MSKNSISVGSESILGSGVARLNILFSRRVIECLLYLVVPISQDMSRFCVNKCSGHFWARKQVTESCMSCYFLVADLPCMTPMHVAIRVSRTRIGRYHLFARPANVLEDLGFDAGAANGSRSVCSLMTSHDASSLLMCWLHNSLNFVWTEGHAAKKVITGNHET